MDLSSQSTPEIEGKVFDPKTKDSVPVAKSCEVKPSTELISDEYEHTDNSKGLVLVFYSHYETGNCEEVRKTFKELKYKVDGNVFPLDTKVNVKGKLKEITRQNHNDKTCLLLFFLARTNKNEKRGVLLTDNDDEIPLKEVWNMFVTLQSFRNKPKVFIFQGTDFSDRVTTDSYSLGASNYDVPIEADLFIVYNHAKSTNDKFIHQLCKNIKNRGKRDDLIDLITHKNLYNVPLMISTLTRRFYVEKSKFRGYYLDQHDLVLQKRMTIYNVRDMVAEMKKDQSFSGSCPSLVEEKGPRRHSSYTNSKIEALDSPESGQKKERRRLSSTNLDVPPTTPRPRTNSKGKKPVWKP